MAVETLMFKLEGVKQATQVSPLVGKTFTVGKVTGMSNGAGNGLFKWLFLVPSGETASSTVALKIEGGRQAAHLAGLAGKTVTVGQSPTVIGGMSKWLVLMSGGGAAGAGAAGAGVAGAGVAGAGVAGAGVAGSGAAMGAGAAVGSNMLLMQLEGVQQAAQVKALSGQTFTVIKSPVIGAADKGWLFMKPMAAGAGKDVVALQIQNGTVSNLSGMVGKSFTLFKAPLATGNTTGCWVVFKPVSGAVAKGAAGAAAVAAKGAAGKGMVAKGAVATGVVLPELDGIEELGGGIAGKTTAKTAAVQGGGAAAAKPAVAAAKPAAAAMQSGGAATKPAVKALAGSGIGGTSTAAVAAKSGTIWNGTGLSLGLGWGLGAWGPVLLAGLVAAVGYGAYQYYRNRQELDAEGDMVEAGQ